MRPVLTPAISPTSVRRTHLYCRECGRRRRMHRNGLCRPCYDLPEVRNRHRPLSIKANKTSVQGGMVEPPIPSRPTCAPPGSRMKVEVMRRRAKKRKALRHPYDEVMDPETETKERALKLLGPAVRELVQREARERAAEREREREVG